MHDVSTFKATYIAPLLNILRKMFPGDLRRDTEPGHHAVGEAGEGFTNGGIKGTHSLRSREFVSWVCNEWSLEYGEGTGRET